MIEIEDARRDAAPSVISTDGWVLWHAEDDDGDLQLLEVLRRRFVEQQLSTV